jgi:tape measure domain-containing protein
MAIELEVKSKSTQVLKDMELLNSALSKISKEADRVSGAISKIKASNASSSIDNISKSAKSLNATHLDKTLADSAKAADHLSTSTGKLASSSKGVASLSSEVTKLGTAASSAKNTMGGLAVPTRTASDLAAATSSMGSLNRAANSVTQSFSAMQGVIAITAAAAAGLSLANLQDSFTEIENKVSLSTDSTLEFTKGLSSIRGIAMNTRSSLAGISSLYSKIALSSNELGLSQSRVANLTESVAKAINISGSSTQEASAALLQFGQALSSGRLQGDELRSISENASGLYQSIARGLGVTTGQLKAMGEAGVITSAKLVEALENDAKAIDKRFGKSAITFGQAFTNIGTSLRVLMDEVTKVLETRGLAEVINNWSKDIFNFATNFKINFAIIESRVISFGIRLSSIFSSLQVRVIDVAKFLPGLDTAVAFVDRATKTMERAFFWLYDQVVGHSWFPDLVLGVGKWAKILVGAPLKTAMFFVTALALGFESLPKEIKAPLMEVVDVLGSLFQRMLAATKTGFKSLYAEFAKTGPGNTFDGWASKQLAILQKSDFNVRLHQFFGDNPGVRTQLSDGRYTDPNSRVPLGPNRSSNLDALHAGHDQLQSLPDQVVAPAALGVVAGMTSMVTKAFNFAFKSPSLQSGFSNVASTMALIWWERVTHSDQRFNFVDDMIATPLRKASQFFGDQLFGDDRGGISDPLAILKTIGKVGLAFESFRTMLLDAGKSIAKSFPLAGANAAEGLVQKMMSGLAIPKMQQRTQGAVSAYESAVAPVTQATNALVAQLKRTANMSREDALKLATTYSSASVGEKARMRAAQAPSMAPLFTQLDRASASIAQNARANDQLRRTAEAYTSSLNSMRENNVKATAALKEASNQAWGAARNAAAATGGAVGAVYGGFIGNKVAEKYFKDSSQLTKGAVEVGGAAVGASLGGAIGGGFISVVRGSLLVLSSLFVTPLTRVLGSFLSAFSGILSSGVLLISRVFSYAPVMWGTAIVSAIAAGFLVAFNWDVIKPVVTQAWAFLGEKLGILFDQYFPKDKGMQKPGSTVTAIRANVKTAAGVDPMNVSTEVAARNAQDRTNAAYESVVDSATVAETLKNIEKLQRTQVELAEATKLYREQGGSFVPNFRDLENKAGSGSWLGIKREAVSAEERKQNLEALQSIKDGMDAIASWFRKLPPVFQSSEKFATGGKVLGRGTGTSDSIPAMLSNGEFVVNARSTARFAPLLTAINSGQVGAFAEGGLVNNSLSSVKSMLGLDYLDWLTKVTKGKSLQDAIPVYRANLEVKKQLDAAISDASSGSILGSLGGIGVSYAPMLDAAAFPPVFPDQKAGIRIPNIMLASDNSERAAMAAVSLHEVGHLVDFATKLSNALPIANKMRDSGEFSPQAYNDIVNQMANKAFGIKGKQGNLAFSTIDDEYLRKNVKDSPLAFELARELAASKWALDQDLMKGPLGDIGRQTLTRAFRAYLSNFMLRFAAMTSATSGKERVDAILSARVMAAEVSPAMLDFADNGLFDASSKGFTIDYRAMPGGEDVSKWAAAQKTPTPQPFDLADPASVRAFGAWVMSVFNKDKVGAFASGGYISGAGTSRSDSIPAFLSNGEFVVNADATRKFLPLLQQLNSGSTTGFASGTPGTGYADKLNAMGASIQDEQKRILAFLETIAKVESGGRYNISVGNNTFDSYAKHPNMPVPVMYKGKSTTSDAAGAFQFLESTWDNIAKKIGLIDFSPESQNQAAIQLLKDIGAYQLVLEGRWDEAFTKAGTQWQGIAKSVLDDTGKKAASQEHFLDVVDTAIQSVQKGTAAVQLQASTAEAFIDPTKYPDLAKAVSGLEQTLVKVMVPISKVMAGIGKVFEGTLAKSGFNLGDAKGMLNDFVSSFNTSTADITTPTEPKTSAEVQAFTAKRKTIMEGSATASLTALNEELGKFGIATINATEYATLLKESPESIGLTITSLDELESKIKQLGVVSGVSKTIVEKSIERLKGGINEKLDQGRAAPNKKAVLKPTDFGETFAKQVDAGMSTALYQAMSGKQTWKEAFKAYGESMLDSVAKQTIETLTSGLLSSAKAGVSRMFGLGDAQLKEWSTAVSGKIASSFSPKGDVATTGTKEVSPDVSAQTEGFFSRLSASFFAGFSELTSIVNSLFNGKDGLFASIGSSLSKVDWAGMFAGIAGLLGFASGGKVYGPGTSRSDSIPAMLSNGEFVVNAASTARHGALLQSINSGSFSHFADGGVVGGSAVAGVQSISPAVTSDTLVSTITPVVEKLGQTDINLANSITELALNTSTAVAATNESMVRGFEQTDSNINTLARNVSQTLINRDAEMAAASSAAADKAAKVNWVGVILKLASAVMSVYSAAGAASAASSTSLISSSVSTPGVTSFAIDTPVVEVRGLAGGGSVWGEGTATSDSIPAMLSNGEFVVRAKRAAQFRGLLESINSNSPVRLASGGPVGYGQSAMAKSIEQRDKAMAAQQNSTVVNMNITGDISRQTKQEIYKMLPQITSGVNAHNKERGSRG